MITGTAAIVPLFYLIFELKLSDTFQGVSLALAGGMLPAAIFILKDFTDSIPRSYEESARVFGASPFQAMRARRVPGHPTRPGRDLGVDRRAGVEQLPGPVHPAASADKAPAAVLMFSFYDEGGRADLRTISAFSLDLHDPDPVALLVRQQALRIPLPRRHQAVI